MFRRLDNLIAMFTGLAVSVMIVHVCADVAGKYLINQPIPGTIAVVTNYYMPIITFLPLAFVQRADGHISVEVITNLLPESLRRHLVGWTFLLSAVVFAILTVFTSQEAFIKFTTGTFLIENETRIATWPGFLCPPIGYGMMTILLCLQFFRSLSGVLPAERA